MRYKSALTPQEGSAAQQPALLDLYAVSDDDIQQMHSYGDIVVPKLDEFVSLFYARLRNQPEVRRESLKI